MLRAEMRFSQQVHYAICGVFDLAYNGQGERVSIQTISDRQAIPARYLEQIFQRLRKADLVTSKRGPGGGYALAREASQITLREIVEAVEGPLANAHPGGPRNADLGPAPHRPDFLWAVLARRLARALDETTLEGLCEEAERNGVPRTDGDGPMYFI